MPILRLVMLDADGTVVGLPTPRQWMDGERLADGRRSISIDGVPFVMESRKINVMQLRSELGLDDAPPG